jgi:hypothetical protein
MDTFGLAALVALGIKIVSFLKFLRSGWTDDAFTQAVTWVVGIGLVFAAAAANITSGITLYGVTLGHANAASKVLIGMALLSLGSFAYDFKKSRDDTDSAKEPSLLTGKTTSTH